MSSEDKVYNLITTSDGISLFLDLSTALTGFSRTELWGTGMVQKYYDAVNLIIGEREMGRLLGASSSVIPDRADITPEIEARLQEAVLDSDQFGPVARNIIRLWYLGAWQQLPQQWRNDYGATSFDTDHVISDASYRESLVWIAGETHPMGAKQQGFGAWSLPGDAGEGDIR